MEAVNFSNLVGKTILSIKGLEVGGRDVEFKTTSGEKYLMHHISECCENVEIADVCGDIADLTGSPITQADESSSNDQFEGKPEYAECFTWTFYRIATAKGLVVIRWLGESNGYYSESVSFDKM